MISETELIELIRSARHEWLNELQLIKGYLSLNKPDAAEGVIERIIMKAKNEAKLSNLKVPKFTALVLTFNWYSHAFKLDFEVTGHGFDLSPCDDELMLNCQHLLGVFEKHASDLAENQMTLMLHMTEESAVITFDFVGQINDHQQMADQLTKEHLNQSFHLVEHYIEKNEAVMTFEIH